MTYYRDVHAWQMSRAFAKTIYELTATFPKTETNRTHFAAPTRGGVSPQQHRRGIRKMDATRTRSLPLHRARFSSRLETQLLIAADLGYVEPMTVERLLESTAAIGSKLNGLIRYYKRGESPEPGAPSPEPL